MHGLLEFFKEGGPFMLVNVVFVVVALAVVIERLFSIFLRYRMNEKPFVAAVDRYLQAGNIEAAAKVCASTPVPALSRATRNLLKLMRNGYESPLMAVEESMLEVRPLVQARVGWLWSIANIATLVGLIGTIFGLIKSFKATAAVQADQKAAALAKGISEAMNNTAFGLSIAVACIIAHLVINNQATKTVERAEHALFHFVNVHAQWRKGYKPPETQQSTPAAAAPAAR
ncbi:MAG: MotA/TolQ/ExbB proton channel family protein [Myxococcota bacterium]